VSAEISRNRRRLAALGGFCLFWGALLAAVGFPPLFVVVVLGGIVLIAAIHVEGRRTAVTLSPHARRASTWLRRGGRAAGGTAAAVSHSASARVSRMDWQAHRAAARNRVQTAARAAERAAAATGSAATAASRRLAATSGAAAASVADVQRRQTAAREARRLNEQAAALRQEGNPELALEVGERALRLVREAGDRHGEALTLNGIGLAQARTGDEVGALDSYETAVTLLSDLGDRHGAGLVLANLGALHKGQGDDEQARAAWVDALERLEPGTPEHERTEQQLRIAS
jgi:tetratricopeptide (TPR) repeat protein